MGFFIMWGLGMADVKVFFPGERMVGEDGSEVESFSTLHEVADTATGGAVKPALFDYIKQTLEVNGTLPTLAGSVFWLADENQFIKVGAKGVLSKEPDEKLSHRVLLSEITNELFLCADIPGDENIAQAILTLQRVSQSGRMFIAERFLGVNTQNKPPVRAQEKTSRDGNTKAQIVVTDAEREAITANIVEAIKQGKFPATPAGKSPLQDFDHEIRIGGKRDYQATAKANQVYLELFEGDDVLVSDKGEKPNVNRKKKWIAQGLDREYFERAKAKLGIK